MATSLQQLPTELQCSVIRLLDPVGLISMSQASSHFRSLISPQKQHFAERLLELELLPEHGGPCPEFRARDNHISPDPLDPEWSDIRWACTSCLRLLPHLHFDNHSILRLRYRKPHARAPGSPRAVTSWEPSGVRLPRRRKNGHDLSEEKRLRLRYSICVSRGRGPAPRTEVPSSDSLATLLSCGMTGLDGMTQDDLLALTGEQKLRIFDENARSIERERCGALRHLRMCNECRYQHGDLRSQLRGRGRRWKASTLPILPSRRTTTFGTFLDRWFPGFSGALENRHPGYSPLVGWVFMRWIPRRGGLDTLEDRRRMVARERRLAVYTARCPGCARWREVRDFRMGTGCPYPSWKPNVATGYTVNETTEAEWAAAEAALDASRCNACFAAEHGREALAGALLAWFARASALELMWLSWKLETGGVWQFSPFAGHAHCDARVAPREYARAMRALVKHTPIRHGHEETFAAEPGESLDVSWLDHLGVATLRLRLARWKDLWERTKLQMDMSWEPRDMDRWYEEVTCDFDEGEEHWRWLMGARMEVMERPMALVEWALGEN